MPSEFHQTCGFCVPTTHQPKLGCMILELDYVSQLVMLHNHSHHGWLLACLMGLFGTYSI